MTTKPFPERNFMVEVSQHKKHEPNEFYPDGDYCFMSGWLHQKHPNGYEIDYFTTQTEAEAAIEHCKLENPQQPDHWLTFIIYALAQVGPTKPDCMTTRNIQFGKSCSIKVSSSAETVYISLKRYGLVRAHSHINLRREGIERFYPTWYGFTLGPADSQTIFEARVKNCLADYARWAKETELVFLEDLIKLERGIFPDSKKVD